MKTPADCPYYPVSCDRELVRDDREYIRQLEADKQQLEGMLTHMNQLRDAAAGRALTMEERVHQLEAERDAAVDALRLVQEKHEKAAEVIDDEVFPLVDYDVYLRLRNAVDDMMSWEVESDSRGVQKEE